MRIVGDPMSGQHGRDDMLEKLKTALGQTPWDRELRLVYSDCLEENGFIEEAEEQRRLASKKQCRPAKGRLAGARDAYRKTGNSALFGKLYDRNLSISDLRDSKLERRGSRLCRAHKSWKKSRTHRWCPK